MCPLYTKDLEGTMPSKRYWIICFVAEIMLISANNGDAFAMNKGLYTWMSSSLVSILPMVRSEFDKVSSSAGSNLRLNLVRQS